MTDAQKNSAVDESLFPPLSRAGGNSPAPIFSLEVLNEQLAAEMEPLLKAHYLEIAHYQDIELDVDWQNYFTIQNMGMFRAFTARDGSGKLIGYNCFFVKQNLHYRKSLQAANDVIFIDKAHRGFGAKFIDWCDQMLRAEGVQVVAHHVKAAHDWSPMLERMGYEFQDKIMTRRLDR